LRNTNQHIDEAFRSFFANNGYPVYGSLSWRKSADNETGAIVSSFYSELTKKKEINIISNTDGIGI
jgi:hypothetical protein